MRAREGAAGDPGRSSGHIAQLVALMLCVLVGGAAAQIPPHPAKLTFPPLDYEPPERDRYRHVLSNGVVAYLVQDHELPLVTVSVLVRAGAYVDPEGKEGLASAVGNQLRAAGTRRHTAEEFDEEADFLAANISSALGATSGSASANFLTRNAGDALALLFDMLKTPAFQQDRLDLFKTQTLQALERRNDATQSIEAREFARLMRGDHFSTAQVTRASVEAITRDDLVAFHREYFHPGNFIIAVSGDFQRDDMLERLEAAMAGWAAGALARPVPKPAHTPAPGIYVVHKPDVNQSRVSMGHLGIMRGNPDEIAVAIMNDVLGGSGFTSRITNRVRSDEGLAYSAGSGFPAGVHYEEVFRAGFQSRNATVAQAIQIVIDEMERIRREPVAAEELDTVKNYAIEVFPRFFASASAIAGTFANDELTGRDPDYWRTYRDRVRAVTAADIQRVAQQYLHPDRLVILAVGHVDEMLRGNPDRPQYTFEQLPGGRAITRIPLPDPLTMEYPKSTVESR
jgi:zinc protease